MTRKDQIKILNDKIESDTNQYKVDRLNAEISAFSSGNLNKYEFLTRKDLKYKPNALDKAKFEFSPLCKAFSTGLDKTVQGYQEEGVIKLLKDIRDNLAGGNRRDGRKDRDGDYGNNGNDGNDEDDDNTDMSDLETEEEARKSKISKTDVNYDDIIKNLNDKILDLETKLEASKLSNEKKLYNNLQEHVNIFKKYVSIRDNITKEDKNKIYNMLNKLENNI